MRVRECARTFLQVSAGVSLKRYADTALSPRTKFVHISAHMHSDTSFIECGSHEQFMKRFESLDPFHFEYPRGTAEEIEARFSAMAKAYGIASPHLRNWIHNGNILPKVYRD